MSKVVLISIIYAAGILIGALFFEVWSANTTFIKTMAVFIWTIIFLIALFYADKNEKKEKVKIYLNPLLLCDQYLFERKFPYSRIFKTCLGGRPSAALPLAKTMGRSIRMGFLTMMSINSASDKEGLLRPCSAYTSSFLRIKSRGANPSKERISINLSFVIGVFRYSMMVGLNPWFSSNAKV